MPDSNHKDTTCCICFSGGGSGGHLNAGIAIAEQLSERNIGVRALFLTSHRPIDQKILSLYQDQVLSASLNARALIEINLLQLPVEPPRKLWQFPRFLFTQILSVFKAIRSLRKARVQVVVGLGGFASVPGVLAGSLLRLPILLIEQNVVPGRANRFLSRLATVTCSGWPLLKEYRHTIRSPILLTGVPIRAAFHTARTQTPAGPAPIGTLPPAIEFQQERKSQQILNRTEASCPNRPLRLLILGGSQGAEKLNQIVLQALRQLKDCSHLMTVQHQAGRIANVQLRMAYRELGISGVVSDFIDELPQVLRQSDLVVTRAGAVTLAELLSTNARMILVPLSTAADNHQRHNALYISAITGSPVLDETSPDAGQQLADLLHNFVFVTGWRTTETAAAVRSTVQLSSPDSNAPSAGTTSSTDPLQAAGAIVDELLRIMSIASRD